MLKGFYVALAAQAIWSMNLGFASAASQVPIRCEYVKPDSLIKCAVLLDNVSIEDASVNDGKCRSPLKVFEETKLMMKRNFGVDMDGVSSFIRTYNKGDGFSLNVDKGCAVYRFSINVNGAALQFQVPEKGPE
jgi:hypothetical protein